MGWFARTERGFALGIRQMALPLGGALASLTLPSLDRRPRAWRRPSSPSPGCSLTAAVAALVLMRDPPPAPGRRAGARRAAADARRAPLAAGRRRRAARRAPRPRCSASSCSSCTTRATSAPRPRRPRSARCRSSARSCASSPAGARTARACASRRCAASPRATPRCWPPSARSPPGPASLLYPLLAVAAISTMSWNGLAFTAAAEISGRARAGTAMSLQNTLISVGGVAGARSPSACSSRPPRGPPPTPCSRSRRWRPSPCCAPLEGDEDDRIAARALRARETPEPLPVEAT